MGNVPTINAIPTQYKGIEFRSRTEARWAVFLTELGIEWEYEPEGYQLLSGWYLPDFWLPQIDAFLEVKPENREDDERWSELAIATSKRVFVTNGYPKPHDEWLTKWAGNPEAELEAYFPDGGWDHPYFICQCEACGKWGCEFDGRSARIPCKCGSSGDKDYTAHLTNLAADRAAKFRFWNPSRPSGGPSNGLSPDEQSAFDRLIAKAKAEGRLQ